MLQISHLRLKTVTNNKEADQDKNIETKDHHLQTVAHLHPALQTHRLHLLQKVKNNNFHLKHKKKFQISKTKLFLKKKT